MTDRVLSRTVRLNGEPEPVPSLTGPIHAALVEAAWAIGRTAPPSTPEPAPEPEPPARQIDREIGAIYCSRQWEAERERARVEPGDTSGRTYRVGLDPVGSRGRRVNGRKRRGNRAGKRVQARRAQADRVRAGIAFLALPAAERWTLRGTGPLTMRSGWHVSPDGQGGIKIRPPGAVRPGTDTDKGRRIPAADYQRAADAAARVRALADGDTDE